MSLEKLYWDSATDTVLWHGPKKGHFRGEDRYFSGLDFIERLTLHIPPKRNHLVRRYSVYSSRARGTWKRRPALALRAAEFRSEASSEGGTAGTGTTILRKALRAKSYR